MVPIRQNLVSAAKYGIKCPFRLDVKKIVVHNTANQASAANEVKYMISNLKQVSFHYAVDDKEIVQGIPDTRNAWHAGDGLNGKGNREGLAVEICYSRDGGPLWDKAVENAAEFVAYLVKHHNLTISDVTKHQDYSGKHCPHRILDEYGWDNFLNRIRHYLGEETKSNEMYRIRKSWADAKSQIGAFSNLDNAKKAYKEGYYIFDSKGNVVYPEAAPAPAPVVIKKTNEQIAKEVLEGKWGNGTDRKNRLTAAGYDYNAVQAIVAQLVAPAPKPVLKSNAEIAKEVMAGKWGNGNDRKARLEAAGYNYAAVQAEVSKLVKGNTTPARKSNTEIAKEVIAGKWGNGLIRRSKLQKAGYNYSAIQAEVKRLMKK